MDTLWALRIYGPCTTGDLERLVDPATRSASALVTVCALIAQGLAVRVPGGWDLSPKGREIVAARERVRKVREELATGRTVLPAWASPSGVPHDRGEC